MDAHVPASLSGLQSRLRVLRQTLKGLRPHALFPSLASDLRLRLACCPTQPELFPFPFVLGAGRLLHGRQGEISSKTQAETFEPNPKGNGE